ncbi:pyridoxamine 5'-phosphate oxidase family protein [Calidifontibacter indicus]|uniref:pyridoxamine 5'-phosphate oxidase family protein n=1 Tax=Calidifontibacter indicus TaxID=419650 RepID=UPI003D753882
MSVSQSWLLLRSAAVGRLAVVVDGLPDIFPVNHPVDHGTILFRTAQGTKLDAASGHAVAFETTGESSQEAHSFVLPAGEAGLASWVHLHRYQEKERCQRHPQ